LFLPFLEHSLAFNLKTNPQGYFIGDSLTYVDIAVWHTIEATASQFPETWGEISAGTPSLVSFREKIANVPTIAAYMSSDRRGFFEGNSMM
jgi:glutathione S-transferase